MTSTALLFWRDEPSSQRTSLLFDTAFVAASAAGGPEADAGGVLMSSNRTQRRGSEYTSLFPFALHCIVSCDEEDCPSRTSQQRTCSEAFVVNVFECVCNVCLNVCLNACAAALVVL